MPTPIENLTAAVTAFNAAADQAIALIQSLKLLVDDAAANQVVIIQLTDQLTVKTGQLTDAITANTPAP